jgi:ATP-independent RNA helicase DbpA|tara:strand:- start:649 stop:2073 length:1425 start_codon:yes stop_codon:yes gene_type:complete
MTENQYMLPDKFTGLPLRAELQTQLEVIKFNTMTAVQAAALPKILEGRDVVAQASTGSGKTAAFGLGCLQKIDTKAFHVQALILCPTRELAEQVAQTMRSLAAKISNTKVLTLCGGVPLGPQIGSLSRSAHIIVGTPGRVLKHLNKQTLHLLSIETLVLDEADRMLDMGFEDEIQEILSYIPPTRQNLLFSATYPDGVKSIRRVMGKDTIHINVTQSDNKPVISEYWLPVDRYDRVKPLLAAMRVWGGALNLVFCNTKIDCAKVCETLTAAGLDAVALHGDLEQVERNQTLVRFANGSANVLVATDVAARGLDIDNVDGVFNFELPTHAEVYVHRIGRTARAGKRGVAISLVADSEMSRLSAVEEFSEGKAMQLWEVPADLPDVLDADEEGEGLRRPGVYTVEINGGRRSKLRPGDILGALTADKTVPGDAVGKIDLMDNVTYVAIRRDATPAALNLLNGAKIKGRQYRARGVG